MNLTHLMINNIPSTIWGANSKKVFIAVHGNMSHKEDEVIKIFADKVCPLEYQVLSFDLPEHGERKKYKNYSCSVQNCVSDLEKILEYAKSNYTEINLWACSMGAYFSLLAYKDIDIKQTIFLSPVVNMELIIENMMRYSNISVERLKEEKTINTSLGTLYYDYYEYVKNNPITKWESNTNILYGEKDNMQDESTIKEFCQKFNCDLNIMKNGEHYFHKEDQLAYYKKWLDEIIKK